LLRGGITAGADVRILEKSSAAERGLDDDLLGPEADVDGRDRILETLEVVSRRLELLLVPIDDVGGLFRFRRFTEDGAVGRALPAAGHSREEGILAFELVGSRCAPPFP
jgi:hypothetical protein